MNSLQKKKISIKETNFSSENRSFMKKIMMKNYQKINKEHKKHKNYKLPQKFITTKIFNELKKKFQIFIYF